MERSFLPAIAGFIPRPRVDALIDYSLEYTLVLVMAGPGYGKTLSVAHCMRKADVRLLWLSTLSNRTGTAEFWEDFVGAAKKELPEYACQLEKLGFPNSPGSFEQFRRITADTAINGKRLVIVVDNYQKLLDGAVIRFLSDMIESDFHNFSLFILCNAMLPIAETLPSTGILLITDKDLSFTLDETKQMFVQYGYDVSDVVAAEINEVTGGWPLGLRIVCKSNIKNPGDFSSRTLIQIAANLHEKYYFNGYPKHIQAKLILFSLLPRFPLDLLKSNSETERSELYDLLMQHPFVTYDYVTGLFMFQTMYREFLRHKQTLVSLESRSEMQNRAGKWFLEHNMFNEAMDCYWEAADYDGFLESFARLPAMRMRMGITNRILQRLEQIPRRYANQNPEVDFSMALMYLNATDAEKAKQLLLDVEQRILSGIVSAEDKLLLGDIYAALADISVYQNDDTGLEWIKKAYELIPHGSRVHSPELYALHNNSVFFLPYNNPGELERMVDYFMEMAKYSDKVKNGSGFGFEYLFAGEAAYYRENMDEAKIMFNSAIMKAKPANQHDIVCSALLNLARIEIYYGNQKKALELLGMIETHVDNINISELYELRDCAIAFIYMWLDDIEKVPSWFGDIMIEPDEMPIFPGRKQLASAYYLYLSGETSKGYALLLRLEAQLEHKGRWCEKLALYILMAQHHLTTGVEEDLSMTFQKVYDMVYCNDLKVALAEYGKDMMAIIDKLKKINRDTLDMGWLDEVYRDSLSYAKRLQMMRRAYKGDVYHSIESSLSLTARQNETLRYLAQGLTQPEIAKLMGISSNAVKKHVSKIYNKLGAVNRADAIHIASINGLVDVLND